MKKNLEKFIVAVFLTLLFFCIQVRAEPTMPIYNFHGQGWVDIGRIMHSPDSVSVGEGVNLNLNGNWMQFAGAQITLTTEFNSHTKGEFGFGAHKVAHAMATEDGSTRTYYYTISLFESFITKASLSYSLGDEAKPYLLFKGGNFSYNYNSNAKNLGHYLLRGPVYPGLLMGGFQDFSIDTTKSNIFGFQIHNDWKNLSQDLILQNENQLPPTFDWSLIYLIQYKAFDALTIAGGINFYRLIPYNSKLEKPGHLPSDAGKSIEVNPSVPSDTLFYTHQGIKTVLSFSLDPKIWIGSSLFGPNDLIIYGEAGVLGIQNYGKIYNDIKRRIPIMAGINIPSFNILDLFSLEVEWYNSPYRNDLANIGNLNNVADWTDLSPTRPTPSPIPVMEAYSDSTADNFKWSVNLEKTFKKHIRFSSQIANDHFRPRPTATGSIRSRGGTTEAFTSPKDWYLMFRIGYFF